LRGQGDDYYAVYSLTKDPMSKLEQWQFINKTSWFINDDLTLKNILSYSDLKQVTRTDVYGIGFNYPGGGQYGFTESGQIPGLPTNSQASIVEEIQLQGYAFDGDLNWTVGLYFENSFGDGASGSLSANGLYCSDKDPYNPSNSLCSSIGAGLGRAGGISRQSGEIEYMTQAAFTEVRYDITDEWKVTAGLRYTKDQVDGDVNDARVWTGFPQIPAAPGTATIYRCVYDNISNPGAGDCKDEISQDSEAVTGLLDFDYFLTQDVMLYAKYARGYRMGSVNLYGGDPYRKFDPETVDAYEIGAKTTFGGPVPGTFNISAFYNELNDQQLQIGMVSTDGRAPTTGITNAGKATIEGFEIETMLKLTDSLTANVSYTYLDTELKKVEPLPGTPIPGRPGITIFTAPDGSTSILSSTAQEGGDLSLSPRHSVVASLNYKLPLPAEIGEVSVGTVYSYTAKQFATAPSSTPYALLPSYEIVNFNANWNAIMGSSFDAGLFVTNAFDEEYAMYVPGNFNSVGIEMRSIGTPRMYGARVKYNFGM